MATMRLLASEDLPQLRSFLARHASTTMFMRSNLAKGGIEIPPRAHYAGAYAGLFEDELLMGVVAQAWNGMLMVESERSLRDATECLLRATKLHVTGLSGRLDQVEQLTDELGLGDATRTLDSTEYLYQLDLDELRLPDVLRRPGVVCRAPRPGEIDLLVEWRVAYYAETLGQSLGDAEAVVRRNVEEGTCRIVAVDDVPVAHSHFNASVADMVQVGGVWTPPGLRGRGYARAVVAGHLAEARSTGVAHAILFTAHANVAAQRAYEALGFNRIGDFGLTLFAKPWPA